MSNRALEWTRAQTVTILKESEAGTPPKEH